jgi:hypothetical protein
MKPITVFFNILLISLLIITIYPYTSIYEGFQTVNTDINLNLRLINDNKARKTSFDPSLAQSSKPRVIVPLYAPWRMYYPYESVYSNTYPWQYQSSPFYPFFDQYNIYQNMIPW